MTRPVDADPTVVPARPDLGGGAATPSRRLPGDATSGLPARPRPLRLGPATFDWGLRTYVMGILNITDEVIRFLITRPDLKAIAKADAAKAVKLEQAAKRGENSETEESEE